MSDKFVFFWGGPCSQWYHFVMHLENQHFNCCEQWMMYNKAMLFEDFDAAKFIMSTSNPREQKAAGRRVQGYNDDQWMEVAYDIVVRGNHAKFTQGPELYDYLKSTGDKIIVEASPYDTRWGIGMGEGDPGIEDPSNWKGENLLGKAIMQVREELFGT